MKINVVIINGKPRSGKDTVIHYMRRYCAVNECSKFKTYSTIDPIKDMLRQIGWDGKKDDTSRGLLSLLKQYWINNGDGPLKYCMDAVFKEIYSVDCDDVVLVFQIREPDEIDKLVNALNPLKLAYNISVSTLLVCRPEMDGKEYNNTSDDGVMEYGYNTHMYNTSTLSHLEEMVNEYMNKIIIGGK